MGKGVTGKPRSRGRGRGRGLTLIELMLALAITGIVAAAIASMMMSVSYGTTSKMELRSLAVRLKTLTTRIDAALRSATMVLADGENYVVLWVADTRRNALPNLSELRLIERDAATGRVTSRSARFPAEYTQEQIDAADVAYQLVDDFPAVVAALKSGPLFPSTLWADGVEELSLSPNHVNVQMARMVSYQLTVAAGASAESTIGAVSLRNIDRR